MKASIRDKYGGAQTVTGTVVVILAGLFLWVWGIYIGEDLGRKNYREEIERGKIVITTTERPDGTTGYLVTEPK